MLPALLAWLAALAVVGFIIYSNEGKPAKVAERQAAAEKISPPGMIQMLGKSIVIEKSLEARTQALSFLPLLAGSPSDQVRAAVIVAEVEGKAKGLEKLDSAAKNLPAESVLASEAAFLRRVIDGGGGALSEEEAKGLVERHDWIGRLALVLGRGDDDPQRAAVLQEAARLGSVLIGMNVALLGVVLAAIGAVIFGVIWFALGKVRRAYAPPAPGGSVHIEVFGLFMVGFVVISLVGELAAPYIGDFAAGWLRWLLLLIPLLWPAVRGSSWGQYRYALGWNSGRGVAREMVAGAVGYLACTPVMVAGVVCMLVVMGIRGAFSGPEQGPAPSHPLGEMLFKAGPWEIVQLLLLATVWAPVVEETVFRGALYHHLRGRMLWPVAGLVQGFLFAIIHPQGWVAAPLLTSMGLVFAMLREWRGSCIASMTAHALNNGAITLLLLVVIFSQR